MPDSDDDPKVEAQTAEPPEPTDTRWPYMLGQGGGTFAFYGNGAVRRIGNTEVSFLKVEREIRTFNLDPSSLDYATRSSKHVFGV